MILSMLTHNKIDLRVSQVNEFLHAPLLQGSCKAYKIFQNWYAQKSVWLL